MRTAVFGASGFVGQNVVKTLAEEGVDVVAVDLKKQKWGANVEFVAADILDDKHMESIIEGTDTVIHLAASTLRTSLRNPKRNVKINVNGTLNILEAAKNHGVKKVVYSSASSVYGVPQQMPVNEEHPKNPTTVYGVTKLAGEHLLRTYNKLHGIDYFIFRFTNVYGPHQAVETGGLIPVVMARLIKGEEVFIYGEGNQTRDFVYVGDIARLITKVALDDNIRNQTVNGGSGTQTTIKEIIEMCSQVLDITPNLVHKPEEGGERKGFQADMTKCKKVVGNIPETSLEDGLMLTAEWIKATI